MRKPKFYQNALSEGGPGCLWLIDTGLHSTGTYQQAPPNWVCKALRTSGTFSEVFSMTALGIRAW